MFFIRIKSQLMKLNFNKVYFVIHFFMVQNRFLQAYFEPKLKERKN